MSIELWTQLISISFQFGVTTVGDKSVETLGNKIRFSPFPQNNVDFAISSTA